VVEHVLSTKKAINKRRMWAAFTLVVPTLLVAPRKLLKCRLLASIPRSSDLKWSEMVRSR
jgi:hypothetical protein